MLQIQRSAQTWDVVIIGSGAGGGTVTKVLTDLGISVALLEAGPMLNPATDFKEHMWPYQVPHRGSGVGGASYFGRGRPFGYFSAHAGGWELDGEPYTTGEGSRFQWFRSRIVGGRTNHYGRISLRYADYDFKPHSRDGIGTDWPISYEDLAPYYDKTERFIGVTGSKEGIRSAPDGIFQTCPPPHVHEVLIRKASDKLGIPCIANRLAVITRQTNGRVPCHYCGQCGRGCVSASNYSSSQVQIFPALKTGRLHLITGAMARELITDGTGKVTAVSYIDKATGTETQIRCRAVVLAASCCESTRLLLNSRGPGHANGLANSSGMVGRNLTDSTGFGLSGRVPALDGMPRHDSDGMGAHVYMPWWLWDKKLDFPRGYHIEIGGGYHMPDIGSFQGVCASQEGYGESLKRAIYDDYGTHVSFAGRGEMIPNAQTWCEIDPAVVDKWGIPVLRFHFQWSDAELKQVEHMERTFTSLIETMGGTVSRSSRPIEEKISVGGEIIHEVGAIRMGNDPKTSALNKYCQAHDVKNLFVADAAPFVSNPDKNPTLTICALAWRTAEYLAEELGRKMFDRREWLTVIAAAALAGPLELQAAQSVHEAVGEGAAPKALTPHEFDTLKKLCELIVPGAGKGGAAEFIDLLSSQNPQMQQTYTGGLAWLDSAMKREHAVTFLSATAEQQKAMLDKVAYRRNETPELAAGIQFFDFARRMTVDAYYTSAAGIKELGYMGNKGMKEFKVPPEALAHALAKSGLA